MAYERRFVIELYDRRNRIISTTCIPPAMRTMIKQRILSEEEKTILEEESKLVLQEQRAVVCIFS